MFHREAKWLEFLNLLIMAQYILFLDHKASEKNSKAFSWRFIDIKRELNPYGKIIN